MATPKPATVAGLEVHVAEGEAADTICDTLNSHDDLNRDQLKYLTSPRHERRPACATVGPHIRKPDRSDKAMATPKPATVAGLELHVAEGEAADTICDTLNSRDDLNRDQCKCLTSPVFDAVKTAKERAASETNAPAAPAAITACTPDEPCQHRLQVARRNLSTRSYRSHLPPHSPLHKLLVGSTSVHRQPHKHSCATCRGKEKLLTPEPPGYGAGDAGSPTPRPR